MEQRECFVMAMYQLKSPFPYTFIAYDDGNNVKVCIKSMDDSWASCSISFEICWTFFRRVKFFWLCPTDSRTTIEYRIGDLRTVLERELHRIPSQAFVEELYKGMKLASAADAVYCREQERLYRERRQAAEWP
jgi:hypothetical protein